MGVKKIIALGAHPDDIELGCGGTLLKAISSGIKIKFMVMSKGRVSSDQERDHRVIEQEEVGRRYGIEVEIFDEDDTQIDCARSVYKLDKKIDSFDPDLIFAPYYEDTHQDHRAVGQAALSLCRRRGNLLFYELPLATMNFNPSIYSDITKFYVDKLGMVSIHDSQMKRTPDLFDRVASVARHRGNQIGVEYAEAFMPRGIKC